MRILEEVFEEEYGEYEKKGVEVAQNTDDKPEQTLRAKLSTKKLIITGPCFGPILLTGGHSSHFGHPQICRDYICTNLQNLGYKRPPNSLRPKFKATTTSTISLYVASNYHVTNGDV
ncbi:hypothetical protein LWI28_009147 [Acer negundo]|uniref:Uncharacterized protein n=1 Tax=Acer negundo TaxID=4023 RepID=A0AAD5ILU8_ACENE|nr:hypothetical protein LWI28_009147 [Acer negundo]